MLAQVFDGLGGSQFCRSMGEVDSVSTICACSKQQEAGTMDTCEVLEPGSKNEAYYEHAVTYQEISCEILTDR